LGLAKGFSPSAVLHAPAAFVSSLIQMGPLVARILGHPVTPIHLSEALSDLARAAERVDWVSVEEIDVPPASMCPFLGNR